MGTRVASYGIFAVYMMTGLPLALTYQSIIFMLLISYRILPKCTFYCISNFINKTNHVAFTLVMYMLADCVNFVFCTQGLEYTLCSFS